MSLPTAATPRLLAGTLTPFLYPCLDSTWRCTRSAFRHAAGQTRPYESRLTSARRQSTTSTAASSPVTDINQYDHLNPSPPDYSSQSFTDCCSLRIHSGAGGHGCISFLREKYIEQGPPNGGDGGTGGNIYIQAVRGETSLHKLARRGIVKAGRGRNGEGGTRGGKRGEDVLVTVPVGTVVREVRRFDPLEEEEEKDNPRGYGRDLVEDGVEDDRTDQRGKWRRDKWLIYPGTLPKSFSSADFPALPRPRRSNLVALQPPAPLRLDLDKPMDTPLLLAAGAMGGLGNTHFVTKSIPRPKFATKGDEGMRIHLQLELKLLADVGLVGLPNAGKSTLLRALTRSRTRVGDWAFTTLSPNIGTLVLDSHVGRPRLDTQGMRAESRTSFTVADIPGLIEDAHLDRGLGLGFLRHIERAAVLAFVLDLSAGDAVEALKTLWKEVGEYEKMREQELNADSEGPVANEEGMTTFRPFEPSLSPDPESFEVNEHGESVLLSPHANRPLPPLSLKPISSKPWLVVATKADLPDTQENFTRLREYVQAIQGGMQEHPSSKTNAWKKTVHALPVSAINKEGVGAIPEVLVELLDG